MNYYPSNYSSKIKALEEAQSACEDLSGINFSIETNSEDSYDINKQLNSIEKEVNSSHSIMESSIETLKSEIISQAYEDFQDALKLYVFLISKDIEEETFPFTDWVDIFDGTKLYFHLKKEELNIIFKNNHLNEKKQLYEDNLKEMVILSQKEKMKKDQWELCSYLAEIIENKYGYETAVNILSCNNYQDITQAITKSDVFPNEKSPLFFKFATKQLAKLGLEKFSESLLWKKIQSKEQKQLLIENLVDIDAPESVLLEKKYKYFKNNRSYYSIENIKWDKAHQIVDFLLKDDKEMVEVFVEKLFKCLEKNKQQEHTLEGVKLLNRSHYYALENNLPQNNGAKGKIKKI